MNGMEGRGEINQESGGWVELGRVRLFYILYLSKGLID